MQEICLNAVGIVVGLCMFLVAQMILVFAFAHFWQRGRARTREKAALRQEEEKRQMFNPYAATVTAAAAAAAAAKATRRQ